MDLSGWYATCEEAGSRGDFAVGGYETEAGNNVRGMRDYIRTDKADADAVDRYIRVLLDPWIREEPFQSQVNTLDSINEIVPIATIRCKIALHYKVCQ